MIRKTIILIIGTLFSLSGLSAQDSSDEQGLSASYFTALYQEKNEHKADSIKQVLLSTWPKGPFARRLAAESLTDMSDTAAFISACDAFRRDFPIEDWYETPDNQGFVYMNFYRVYANFLYKAEMWDKLREVMPGMSYSMLAGLYFHGPMFMIMKAPIDPREYVDISVDMIRHMLEKKDKNVDMYSLGTILPDDGSINRYLSVETEILYRSGRYGEAVGCMEKIPVDIRYEQYTAGNEAYVLSLQETGRSEDAVKALHGAASVACLTPKLYSMLVSWYNSQDEKPVATFGQYYSSLKTPQTEARLRDHVMAGMQDAPFEPFKLTSVDGKKVKSSSFAKDEIIVLDFWATWCGPCIAALEGMQLAVDKYADDDQVRFYFVCTQDEPDKNRVQRVWTRGGYRNMTVLFDECRKGSKGYDRVYRSMIHGTSGIPQKAVLKGGRVRYVAEGYGGSPSGLMDEISAVIDILKNE